MSHVAGRDLKVAYYVPGYRRNCDPGVWRQGVMEGAACAEAGVTLCPDFDNTNGIDLARNRTLEGARIGGFDYLFMQDSDTYATVAVIPRLLDIATTHEAAIVAVGYPLRRHDKPTVNVYPLKLGEVYAGHLAGTGLMLIDVAQVSKVAEDYDGPWFARGYDERGTQLKGGGDVHFCELMHQRGLAVWIDTTIRTEHIDTRPIVFDPTAGGNSGDANAEQ